jgi:hypothetical protein
VDGRSGARVRRRGKGWVGVAQAGHHGQLAAPPWAVPLQCAAALTAPGSAAQNSSQPHQVDFGGDGRVQEEAVVGGQGGVCSAWQVNG